MIDNMMPKCRRIVTALSVMFVDQVKKINFLFVNGVPVKILIGIPDMERFGAQINSES